MEFKTTEDKVCYGIGTQVAAQLTNGGMFPGFNVDALIEGVKDALNGNKLQLDVEEIKQAFNEINQKLTAEQAELAKEAKAKSEAFLAENAKKDGVTVTASGLQYEVLAEGNGEKPSKESVVKVHYHGTLADGTVFDSSVQRGEPAVFPLNQVIRGWTEGLQLMKVGSKFRFAIPSDLAYGDQGTGPIPPAAALVFEVELLEIVK